MVYRVTEPKSETDEAGDVPTETEEPMVDVPDSRKGRGGSRLDQLGNNLAGRKSAASSLAASASSLTKVTDFLGMWETSASKQATKRQRAQEAAIAAATDEGEVVNIDQPGRLQEGLGDSMNFQSAPGTLGPTLEIQSLSALVESH